MIDYSSDIDFIRRLHRFGIATDAFEIVVRPALAVAKLFGRERLEKALSAVDVLDDWSERTNRLAVGLWRLRYGVDSFHRSHAIRALAKAGEYVGTLSEHYSQLHYHVVLGVPIAPDGYDNSDVFYGPAAPAEIFERLRESGSRWVIAEDGGLRIDDAPLPESMAAKTVALIARVQRFDTCRGIVLWGPPRGGKSVAARQIAHEIAGGWVRVCGRASASPAVWAAVAELKPEALILDDLDTCSGAEDNLLEWLEQARGYAKVIVSTMNILPGSREPAPEPTPDVKPGPEALTKAVATVAVQTERKRHELRGALLAPGRAADELPVHYADLDDHIRAELAPDVPENLRPPDLLAAYIVELQRRAVALGEVTDADLAEMRQLMAAVGER